MYASGKEKEWMACLCLYSLHRCYPFVGRYPHGMAWSEKGIICSDCSITTKAFTPFIKLTLVNSSKLLRKISLFIYITCT